MKSSPGLFFFVLSSFTISSPRAVFHCLEVFLPPSDHSTRSSFFPHNQSEKQLAFPQCLSYVVPVLTKLLEELMTHLHSFPYSKRNWMILKTGLNFPCYHKYCLSLTQLSHIILSLALACFDIGSHPLRQIPGTFRTQSSPTAVVKHHQ